MKRAKLSRSAPGGLLVRAGRAISAKISAMFAEIGQIGMFVWKTITPLPTTIRHYRKQTLKTMNDMAWGSGSIIVDGGVVSLMFFLGIAVGAVVAIMAFMAFDLLGFGALTGIISSFGNIRVVAPIYHGYRFRRSGRLPDDRRDRCHADLGRDRCHRGDGPARHSVRGRYPARRRHAGGAARVTSWHW